MVLGIFHYAPGGKTIAGITVGYEEGKKIFPFQQI
jgi:hypothetical protein